jgi:hypothetical protein
VKGVCMWSKEGNSPFPRGNNSQRVKIHWKFLRIFFSGTSCPESIKLGINYPWEKGIKVCWNKRPDSLQRWNNHKNVKMGWSNLKKNFSKTTGPILTRLSTNHPWREKIQVFIKRVNSPFFKGI